MDLILRVWHCPSYFKLSIKQYHYLLQGHQVITRDWVYDHNFLEDIRFLKLLKVDSKLEDEDEDIEEKKVNPAICLQSFFLILTFFNICKFWDNNSNFFNNWKLSDFHNISSHLSEVGNTDWMLNWWKLVSTFLLDSFSWGIHNFPPSPLEIFLDRLSSYNIQMQKGSSAFAF